MKASKGQKAASQVLSLMLLIIITVAVGIILFSFTTGMVENLTKPTSTQPFSLRIDNVVMNDTYITVYIRNAFDQDVTIDTVYVNSEPHTILRLVDNKVTIPKTSTGKVYIMGAYTAGARYEIKIICSSGFTLFTMVTY